jgi:hypothetical protein
MAVEAMQFPVREIDTKSKRELPDFVIEEARTARRIMEPEIIRPVRPSYAFIRTRTVELAPVQTTPEMQTWEFLRSIAHNQANYPRWAGSIAVGSEFHTGVWYSVAPQESHTHYCTLRCSCNLPDIREPDTEEYIGCDAQDGIISDRAQTYRKILGIDGDQLELVEGGLTEGLGSVILSLKNDHLAWPPSHRSDVLLVDGMAMTFNVNPKKIMNAAFTLQKQGLLEIRDYPQPVLSLAA